MLSGYTKEGFECEIKNYPNIYENELIKGSMLDAGKMYQFSDALKEDENKNVVEPDSIVVGLDFFVVMLGMYINYFAGRMTLFSL